MKSINKHVPAPSKGATIWINQTIKTSPFELFILAFGHCALGFIIGYAIGGLNAQKNRPPRRRAAPRRQLQARTPSQA